MTLVQLLDIFLPLLGVLLVGVLVPVYLVGRANNDRREDNERAIIMHREDREAEWARQDELAARAAKAQKDLSEQAAKAARMLRDTADETHSKLDVINTLVNGNMTAAMHSEYDAVARELAVMREIMELKKANGLEPSTAVLMAIAATETKLNELRAALEDRAEAQKKVEEQ